MDIKELMEERKKREEERDRELQERFNADTKDIIAFSIAAWQLFVPLIVALLIVGFIVIFLFNLV